MDEKQLHYAFMRRLDVHLETLPKEAELARALRATIPELEHCSINAFPYVDKGPKHRLWFPTAYIENEESMLKHVVGSGMACSWLREPLLFKNYLEDLALNGAAFTLATRSYTGIIIGLALKEGGYLGTLEDLAALREALTVNGPYTELSISEGKKEIIRTAVETFPPPTKDEQRKTQIYIDRIHPILKELVRE